MSVLRSLLLIILIGGGFSGFLLCFDRLLSARYLAGDTLAVFLVALFLYLYILWAGLVYANHPGRTRPLKIALLLQLPWFATPLVDYHLVSAFGLSFIFYPDSWRYEWHIGSSFLLGASSGGSWGMGFNLVALIFLIVAFLV